MADDLSTSFADLDVSTTEVDFSEMMGVELELSRVRTCREGVVTCKDCGWLMLFVDEHAPFLFDVNDLKDCVFFRMELRVGACADRIELAGTRGILDIDEADCGLEGLFEIADVLPAEIVAPDPAAIASSRASGSGIARASRDLSVFTRPMIDKFAIGPVTLQGPWTSCSVAWLAFNSSSSEGGVSWIKASAADSKLCSESVVLLTGEPSAS